jgi:hypothetical protein
VCVRQLSELEGGDEKAGAAKGSKPAVSYEIAANKEKAILAPEEVFFEGPPSWTEMVIPGISILTVIGIVPFIATATRQAWVKYKITSRRISVTSGFNGQVTKNRERDRGRGREKVAAHGESIYTWLVSLSETQLKHP